MKAIVLQDFATPISLQSIPIPQPRRGQVLVKIEASPINPGDLVFLSGGYVTQKPLPCVPGFEGSGTVVASGGGLMGWYLKGKRVACASGFDSPHGCWAEYMVTDAMHCVELPATVSFDEGACFFGNPLTAVMMLDVIKQGKHRAVVQSAAASALSKMVLRLCHAEGIPVVNIVRRPAQVRALQDLGAEFVLNSDDTAFDQDLKALCSRLQVSVGFDSVAGEMTGTMLQALMPGGTAYVLGVLSGQPASGLTGQDLIFHKKRVEGLNLRDWLASSSSYKKLRAIKQVSSQLSTVFKTDIVQRYSLEQFEQALHTYQVNMSAGKVLFAPS